MDSIQKPESGHKKKKIRVLRPSQIVNKERNIIPFDGKFKESFGLPEKHARWFITGPSFSGKSSFIFEVCNYLSTFGIVDYNNHEEAGGDSDTVAKKIIQSGMVDKDGKVRLYKAPITSESHETFFERINRKQSADFAVLDSIQHAQLNKVDYLHMTNILSNPRRGKSFLFISHWVKNDYTKFIKHDCDIKIEVIGFVAHVDSRYGGGKPFIIWEQGAKDYWGKKYKEVMQGKYWPGKKK